MNERIKLLFGGVRLKEFSFSLFIQNICKKTISKIYRIIASNKNNKLKGELKISELYKFIHDIIKENNEKLPKEIEIYININ